MLDKVMFSLYRAYFNAKVKLMSLANEEDGMQMVETIVLILVAIIIAVAIFDFLQGDKGIIKNIFSGITERINELLSK